MKTETIMMAGGKKMSEKDMENYLLRILVYLKDSSEIMKNIRDKWTILARGSMMASGKII